jgi:hypothetical protein
MKPFYTSKTIWFGIGQIFFGIVGLIAGWLDSGTATTLIITGLGSIGLRYNTSQTIS